MTSIPRTWIPCERTQCQDSNNRKTTTHAITLSDHEGVKVYDGACNNTSLAQMSAEDCKLVNIKVLPNSVTEEEQEICFGMVSLRMQIIIVKVP
jgi:hypothetical protein